MNSRLVAAFRKHEIYIVSTVIAVVFVAAIGVVAWMLHTSIGAAPYEALSKEDLGNVFATGYLRFREDDGTPYLKVELHNGTLWWIKQVEFKFDGVYYSLMDPHAFRPLHFGALRCILKKIPPDRALIEYDLKILKAFGYPPADHDRMGKSKKIAGELDILQLRNAAQ